MMDPRAWGTERRFVAAGILLSLTALSGAACGAGGVRPRFEPFPDALSDTAAASPDSAILAAAAALEDEGIELRHVRPHEGYLETRWLNVTEGGRGSPESVATDDMVRIRFWADAVSERRTLVVGEAVMPRVVDPSLPPRERETLLPDDHSGFVLLQRVFHAVMAELTEAATP